MQPHLYTVVVSANLRTAAVTVQLWEKNISVLLWPCFVVLLYLMWHWIHVLNVDFSHVETVDSSSSTCFMALGAMRLHDCHWLGEGHHRASLWYLDAGNSWWLHCVLWRRWPKYTQSRNPSTMTLLIISFGDMTTDWPDVGGLDSVDKWILHTFEVGWRRLAFHWNDQLLASTIYYRLKSSVVQRTPW